MTATRISTALLGALVLLAGFCASGDLAEALTIYDIQYVDLGAYPSGASPYDLQIVDCAGGIVTHLRTGSQPRLMLQDPDHLEGWGAIQVKDMSGSGAFAGVNVGDRISLTNVYVEDFRGTTFLQFGGNFAPDAALSVESTGNSVPAPMLVTLDQIAAPIDGHVVADHAAEKYESMWLTVQGVTVSDMDLGKAGDNYNLHNAIGDVWATDYMNVDVAGGSAYHSYVDLGSSFIAVTGILEQYEKTSAGWDYYQLMTTCTNDFTLAVPEPGTLVALLAGMACLAGWTLIGRRKVQLNSMERVKQ